MRCAGHPMFDLHCHSGVNLQHIELRGFCCCVLDAFASVGTGLGLNPVMGTHNRYTLNVLRTHVISASSLLQAKFELS